MLELLLLVELFVVVEPLLPVALLVVVLTLGIVSDGLSLLPQAVKVKVKAIAMQIGFKDMLNFPVKND